MKIILTILIMIIGLCSYADAENDALYEQAMPFQSKLYNDVDPYEDEDMINYAWSPYPLFRTSANMYFKDFVIEPGYYTLTPRKLGENYYVLFKQGGKVQFIIPTVKKEATPLNFYQANTPQIKKTAWQKFTTGVKKKFYDTAKSSMRSTPPNSLVNVDTDSKYFIMTLYYGVDKFTVLFKRTPY